MLGRYTFGGFVFFQAINVGVKTFINQMEKELKRTGRASYPPILKIATAMESLTMIFPKNKEGVNVTAK